MPALRPDDPQWIGRFRVEAALGAGGMGRVYLASAPDGRRAAVKVIREDLAGDTGFRHRFRREVGAALAVAGRYTVRVLDADPDAEVPWLATEYVAGPSLREAVERHGPMPGVQLIELARGLAEALGAIHAAGLVHRDLKPANVLLSPTGPKVIDFGIAWSAEGTQLTGTGLAIGTPAYMAPEQLSGEPNTPTGPAIDVFALGTLLLYAATGANPFAADRTAVTLYRLLQHEPDLSRVPAELRGLVRACLRKDPALRPTAEQIAAATGEPDGLSRFSDSRPTATFAPPTPVPGPTPPSYPPTPHPPTPHPPTPHPGASSPSGFPAPHPESEPPRRRTGRTVLLTLGGLAGAAATVLVTVLSSFGGPGGSPTTPAVAQQPSAGTATPAGSAPLAVSTTVTGVDDYVDLWCTAGNLEAPDDLNILLDPFGLALGDPETVMPKIRADMDRLIGTFETGATQFAALRDAAPDATAGDEFGIATTDMTTAGETMIGARDTASAGDPATALATMTGAITTALTVGDRAITRVQRVQLPAEYAAAAATAQHCADRDWG